VNTLAAGLHASAVPLESAGTLFQAGPLAHGPQNFTGTVYVATPQLLATYGIKASQIAPGTDVLTMRPGLAGEPSLEMLWNTGSVSDADVPPPNPGSAGGPPCTLSSQCLASPAIATVSSLPSGTSAPNTVLTEYAVRKYHMHAQLFGWLIQARAPFTAAQLRAVRQFGNASEVQVLTASYNPSLADFTDSATALGIVIALGVLAMSVGVPPSDILILLIGLPLIAAAGGWLFAGREPSAVARQPME